MKPEAFKIPNKPEELITWAERQGDAAYRLPEFMSKQNMAFMLGQQWGVWDKSTKRFRNESNERRGDPNAPVRITINKIGGHVERTIARLTKSIPIPETRPVSDSQDDVNAAKVGTRILDHEMNRLKLQHRLIDLYFWVLPLGWSFLHLRWDPKAGAKAATDPETGETIPVGEIAMEVVPAYEVRLDPNARTWWDARWCRRDVVMTREAVFEQYGVAVEADGSEAQAWEWRDLAAYGEGNVNVENDRRKDTDTVTVKQFWMLPGGRRNPEGLVFTYCGKQMLEGPMPFPYAHNHLPFVPLNLLPPVGGSPAGRTWVTDLVQIQKDYNDARSREATIRRTLTPKIVAPTGSIDPNKLTTRVEVITYNPLGQAPQLQMPDGRWMSQYEQGMDRADAEMGERAGQAEVSQGNAATSAPAASIMALQEADETKLAISAQQLVEAIKELGWQTLMLVKQFWVEERVVRTWSRDGLLEVGHFNQASIGDQLDVHVTSESALPRSKSARVQMAIDLWAQQIITDPKVFVRMLDLPGTDFLVETLNLDAAQAEREHGHLVNKEMVEARVWHNHQAHLQTHDQFRKSEEYDKLPPDVQAHIDGHCMAHYQALQLQAAGMLPGNVGSLGMMDTDGLPGEQQSNGAQTTNPTGQNGYGIDPLTGMPQDPLQVAAGLAPSALNGAAAQASQSPVGGLGNPGAVPGQSADSVAYRTGS